MNLPLKWSTAQLSDDVATAVENFRRERLDEDPDLYADYLGQARIAAHAVADKLRDVIGPTRSHEKLAEIIASDEERRAFLYCGAPPVSEDDLKTLAETTLSRKRMLTDSAAADRVIATMERILDPSRFEWVQHDRAPTPIEIESAVQATAALVAAQQVQTFRRNEGKNRQERAVKDTLLRQGFKEVKRRKVTSLATFPGPGEFMGESKVVGHQADVVAVLPDKRILCIECKVSNSEVNSRKRLVHDAGGKAPGWYNKLGSANAVVIGVLTGVFTVDLCEFVQNQRDVYLFWEHRLDDLADFVGTVP